MAFLPSSFKFSPIITLTTVPLALVMFFLSHWQWERYKAKLILVEAYREISTVDAVPFIPNEGDPNDYTQLVDKKVSLSGRYDYEHQMIVTNKKYATADFSTQPGHFLLTPMVLDGTDKTIIVSRGFVPFPDMTKETWEKYSFPPGTDSFTGVVKKAITPMWLGPKNPRVGEGQPFQTKFFYEEIGKMAKQLPYPIITSVYIQRLGAPPTGEYPAPAVSVEVPPSIHKGYTFEWAFLGIGTLLIGFILQAFPHYRGVMKEGVRGGLKFLNPLEERSKPDTLIDRDSLH